MKHILLVLLLASGCRQILRNADEIGDVGKRVEVPNLQKSMDGIRAKKWPSTPAKVVKVPTPFTMESALAEGKKLGVKIGEADPDLSGKWRQRDEADGITIVQHLTRERLGQGVYRVELNMLTEIDGMEVMKMDMDILEVIGSNRQCQFANEVRLTFKNDAVKTLMGPATDELRPDNINEDVCSPLSKLTADVVAGTDEDGKDPWQENRY